MKLLLGIHVQNNVRIIPQIFEHLSKTFDSSGGVQICLIDNGSTDGSVTAIETHVANSPHAHIWSFRNERAYAHGAIQKILFRLAIKMNFDSVGFVWGPDAIRALPAMSVLHANLQNSPEADVAIGVPLELAGPLSLPFVLAASMQSTLAGRRLKGWHCPDKLYRTRALKMTAFELNASGPHFDTEVLLQLVDLGRTIKEISGRFYARRARGAFSGRHYLINALKASLKYRLQRCNLFYDVRYYPNAIHDFAPNDSQESTNVYEEKFSSQNPHAAVSSNASLVARGSHVLDIGCSSGYVARELSAQRGCTVTGIDLLPPSKVHQALKDYHQINLENDSASLNALLTKNRFDVVLLLDVIEHLSNPELFLLNINRQEFPKTPRFLMSTGNVAFIAVRFMLLVGFFNYGRRGILDVTHKRLFSTRSFKHLMEQTGFLITARHYFPFPFRTLGFPDGLSSVLEKINIFFIRLMPSLFAYQMMFETVPATVPAISLKKMNVQ